MGERALIIEDDFELANLLKEELSGLGYEMEHCSDGRSGLEAALSGDFAFIILDLMLPELEGTDVCKRVRDRYPLLPIIVLTGKSDELSKVLLLELGADDYIVKPFSNMELKARVRGVLRRSKAYHGRRDDTGATEFEILRCGDLTIDLDARTVLRGEDQIDFTAGEFDIVALLATQPGRVFTKDEISESLHGAVVAGFEGAVTSLVNRIRSKLEPQPSKPVYLTTVRKVGYRLVDPNSQ